MHKVTICSKTQWWYDARVRLEHESGGDPQRWDWDWRDRTSRVCNRVSFSHRDELEYEGYYYGRLRISIPGIGWVRYTGWRKFWTS